MLTLRGGVAHSGTGLLTVAGPIDVLCSPQNAIINGHLSLGGGVRTVTVANGSGDFDLFILASIASGSITKAGAGTLAITGTQTYSALLAQAGVTKIFTPLGTGASTVTVTPTGTSATVNFSASQTLASLTICAGGIVNLIDEPVPEPGIGALLLSAALWQPRGRRSHSFHLRGTFTIARLSTLSIQHSTPMKTPRILALSIASFLFAPSLHAVDRFWIDTAGGPFADIANWSATDGGAGGATVPGAADVRTSRSTTPAPSPLARQ